MQYNDRMARAPLVSIVGCGYTGRRRPERGMNPGTGVRGFAATAESVRLADEFEALTRAGSIEALPLP